MIKKISIRGFQSHEDTELELHPGFNVITGSSDSGKSAVIRAIRWVIQNRPIGWDFKPWDKEQKESEVKIHFDNGAILRRRTNTSNAYATSDHEIYQAVKGAIPDQIHSLAKMDEYNLQTQHDTYFLLQESAGEVASKMNEVAGLEIIDKVTDSIEQIVRKTNNDHTSTKAQSENIFKLLEEYRHLDDIAPMLDKLNGGMEELKKRSEVITIISDKIREYKQVEEDYDDVLSFLQDIEDPYRNLTGLLSELSAIKKKINYIKEQVMSYNGYAQSIALCNRCLGPVEEKQLKAKQLIEELEREGKTITFIREGVKTHSSLSTSKNKAEKIIKSKAEEYKNLLEDNQMCPVCGSDIDSNTIQKVLEIV